MHPSDIKAKRAAIELLSQTVEELREKGREPRDIAIMVSLVAFSKPLLEHIDELQQTLETERAERKGVIDDALCAKVRDLETRLAALTAAAESVCREALHWLDGPADINGDALLRTALMHWDDTKRLMREPVVSCLACVISGHAETGVTCYGPIGALDCEVTRLRGLAQQQERQQQERDRALVMEGALYGEPSEENPKWGNTDALIAKVNEQHPPIKVR